MVRFRFLHLAIIVELEGLRKNYLLFFGYKMNKEDNNGLTNQPETVTNPSTILLQVVGLRVVAEVLQMIFGLPSRADQIRCKTEPAKADSV